MGVSYAKSSHFKTDSFLGVSNLVYFVQAFCETLKNCGLRFGKFNVYKLYLALI